MKRGGVKKIAILTGGGDCPGLNGVLRAVVRKATFEHGIEVIGIEDGFEGLVASPPRVRGLLPRDVRGLLQRGGTILGTTNRANPFVFPVKRGNKVVMRDVSTTIVRRLAALRVDALIVVGGDGTLTIAHDLGRLGLNVVGVPKTIDNDLSATDVTFGFDTAVSTAVEALDRLHTTAESHHRIMILEVMGRYAGWIALHAGVAGSADVILLPEFPYDVARIVGKIRERARFGSRYTIIVASEGAFPVGGKRSSKPGAPGALERLVGAGAVLEAALERRGAGETRVTVLGHLQRGGSPTAFDRTLATRLGAATVDAIVSGKFGVMVALRGLETAFVPLIEAVGMPKRVTTDTELFTVARSIGIELAC